MRIANGTVVLLLAVGACASDSPRAAPAATTVAPNTPVGPASAPATAPPVDIADATTKCIEAITANGLGSGGLINAGIYDASAIQPAIDVCDAVLAQIQTDGRPAFDQLRMLIVQRQTAAQHLKTAIEADDNVSPLFEAFDHDGPFWARDVRAALRDALANAS